MIDEKKLIEDLKEYAHLSEGDSVDTIKVAIKIVEEQPKADHLNDIERLKRENESLMEFINEYSSENAILNAQMDVVRLIFGD